MSDRIQQKGFTGDTFMAFRVSSVFRNEQKVTKRPFGAAAPCLDYDKIRFILDKLKYLQLGIIGTLTSNLA
jgi:hypothetical protein